MTIKVKICGITSLKDANTAVKSGADWLGFVFYEESARYIKPEDLIEWFDVATESLQSVGVFVNPKKSWVEHVLSKVELDVLQFHGEESELFCSSFKRPYWKAIRVRSAKQVLKDVKEYPSAQAFLLDAYHPEEWGGTGLKFDWNMVPRFQQPVILAGGLTANNVREAVQVCQPYAVDVSSGVEAKPGIKDHSKVTAFIRAAKGIQK